MKTIQVVAAIIIKDQKVFATQRGYGDFKDGWEFPGGKVEKEETNQDALIREIKEELKADIRVGELLHVVDYDYPKFHLTMHCYLCSLESENIILTEHEAAKWLSYDKLDAVDWLPADIEVVEALKREKVL